MRNDGTAECMVTYHTPALEAEREGRQMVLRLKAIPWARVIVDTLLVAGILLLSANFLTVR
jgi:hypothetical protein